ncbi:MAG: hypothetical protein DRO39_09565, partial [Thermoprotei archaeon]
METKRVRVYVRNRGFLEARPGDTLGDVLAKHGIISLPCGGRGLCGRCLVRVKGRTTPPTGNEILHGVVEQGLRLACQTKILGDVEVEILTPHIAGEKISIQRTIEVPLRKEKAIYMLYDPSREWGLGMTVYAEALTCYKDPVLVDVEGLGVVGSIERSCVGREKILLVDMGTSVVDWIRVDSRGKVVEEGSTVNPQVVYGRDVVSRLSRLVAKPEEISALSRSTKELIAKLVKSVECTALCLIAGNSAVTALLVGMPVNTLAVRPYEPSL